ncbi:GFA family protein [Martelella alba]|uniref:GFA family protein n=1 Tax=Martelella alba TaxID=2590451 RepID=A0A506UJU1_9HYPH|nr:GFA family protein [Martelella alba]
MRLEGSCSCGKVRFSAESRTPYPYQRCYCSICRKTGGGGGYAINIMAEAESLVIEGGEYKRHFHAMTDDGESPGERHFCGACGTSLYLWDPRWPELVHPMASAVDTALPVPPETVHIMLAHKASWVCVPEGPDHVHFDGYPALSIEEWHRSKGLLEEG